MSINKVSTNTVTVPSWPLLASLGVGLFFVGLGEGNYHPNTTFPLAIAALMFGGGWLVGIAQVAKKYVFKESK